MTTFDTVIVGGGPAGLSAALVLGRMRRRVLLCDAGEPRNAVSQAVHGFLSRNGTVPADLLAAGREQLRPYASVQVHDGPVANAGCTDDGIEVTLGDGTRHEARSLLLATGVIDELPPIDGLAVLWGRGVYHCPYCHGWEARDRPLAVWCDEADVALSMARTLRSLSDDVVVCLGDDAGIEAGERGRAERVGLRIHPGRLIAVDAEDACVRLHFADGTTLERGALFLHPHQRLRGELAQRLGCELTDDGLVQVDAHGRTSVRGVFAAGDLCRRSQQAILAAADGLSAAQTINHDLAETDAR